MNIGVSEVIPFSHDADLLECSFDMALPADVREFFNKYNGGKLQLNEVKGFARGMAGLNQSIPASEAVREVQSFGFKKGFLPLAWAEGGNYLVVDLNSGEVYFVDHESRDDYQLLASSVPELLASLVAVAPLMALPSGGRILQIDPDFLRRIQAGEFK